MLVHNINQSVAVSCCRRAALTWDKQLKGSGLLGTNSRTTGSPYSAPSAEATRPKRATPCASCQTHVTDVRRAAIVRRQPASRKLWSKPVWASCNPHVRRPATEGESTGSRGARNWGQTHSCNTHSYKLFEKHENNQGQGATTPSQTRMCTTCPVHLRLQPLLAPAAQALLCFLPLLLKFSLQRREKDLPAITTRCSRTAASLFD